jgi:hypothetical protein
LIGAELDFAPPGQQQEIPFCLSPLAFQCGSACSLQHLEPVDFAPMLGTGNFGKTLTPSMCLHHLTAIFSPSNPPDSVSINFENSFASSMPWHGKKGTGISVDEQRCFRSGEIFSELLRQLSRLSTRHQDRSSEEQQ